MSSRYFEMKTVDNQSETNILFLNVTNCSHPALLDIVTTSRMFTNTCEWLTILQNSKNEKMTNCSHHDFILQPLAVML
jgi:hypothetical protein